MRSKIIGQELSEVIGMVNELNDKTGKLHIQVVGQTLHAADLNRYCICEEALNIM